MNKNAIFNTSWTFTGNKEVDTCLLKYKLFKNRYLNVRHVLTIPNILVK